MIIMITAVWLQNNQSRSLCDWIDNNLITFFTINKFSSRNIQSIWHAAYLSLLFSIAWVIKLKERSQFVVCLAFLVFFNFFLFPAHLPIRSHTQKNCNIAFFDPLIRKHITYARHRNAVAEMPWVLENTGSFILKKFENTVYARFTQELPQLIFKII